MRSNEPDEDPLPGEHDVNQEIKDYDVEGILDEEEDPSKE